MSYTVTGASGRPLVRAASAVPPWFAERFLRSTRWNGTSGSDCVAPLARTSSAAPASTALGMAPKVTKSEMGGGRLTDLWPASAIVDHEPIVGGHDHPGQGLRVHHRGVRHDLVPPQEERDQAVHLIGRQGAWCVERHRAIHIVVQGRRVGPVVAERLHEARVAPEREAGARLPKSPAGN